jgi:2-keto-4-pentenoate hydratase/2-oxohepta-3-ene-1,7-dioic acid hydratase in catechol pathway
MKLLRFGEPGNERPAALDGEGRLRDLSAVVTDLAGDALDPLELWALSQTDLRLLPVVEDDPRIGPCVGGIGKFICLGLNYACNAAALGQQKPLEPTIAMKALSAICGPNDRIELPRDSKAVDWEVELGVVIGRRAKYVDQSDAMNHVAGYCLVNDLADRHLQSARGGDSSKGRGHDSFGPIGPWLVTKDEIPDPQDVRLWLEIDGVRVQDGHCADMFFGVDFLVAYLSRFMTLLPGDLISTGTPAGLGSAMKPPRYLKPGEIVRLGGAGLGEQMHTVFELAEQDEPAVGSSLELRS